jgi:ABC-type uncharacterized transport system substrate-binding protein
VHPAAILPLPLRTIARLLGRALIGTIALVLAGSATAADIALVLARDEPVYRDFVGALRQALPSPSPHRLVDAGSVDEGIDAAAVARADLVIAVGAAAAEAMTARAGHPTLAVMLARQAVEALRRQRPHAGWSAMVLDQPLVRQMRLIRAALPQARRLGVLLGPNSSGLRAEVRAAASAAGLAVDFEEVDDPRELLPALERLLGDGETILALPDPVVFNAESARPVLLTAYRFGRPLIGYSKAYVRAGGLAAVYTSAGDAARQVADWLGTLRPGAVELPPVEAPRYFSVAVNQQVAHALALDVPDAPALSVAVAGGRR